MIARLHPSAEASTWEQANARYLRMRLEAVRVMAARRVIWVRRQHEGLPEAGNSATIQDAAADIWLQPSSPDEAREFLATHDDARSLAHSLSELREQCRESAAAMSKENRPPALDILCAQFGLSELEREVLVIAAAPDLDWSIGRVYAYVQDDVTLPRATSALLQDLLAGNEAERHQIRQALLPDSPLRRYALVIARDGQGFRVDSRVIDYLFGFNRVDETVEGAATAVPELPIAPAHAPLAKALLEWLRGSSKKRWRPVNAVCESASATLSFATAFARHAGLNLYRLDCSRLPVQTHERTEWLRLLAREAVLTQMLLTIEMPDPEPHQGNTPGESQTMANTHSWVEQLPLFFFVSSRARLTTDRPLISVSVPPIGIDDRHGLWEQSLAACGVSCADSLDQLTEQFDFGPQQTLQAAQSVRMKLSSRGRSNEATATDLWDVCRDQSQGHLSGLAKQIIPVYDWNDIVLPEDVINQLREVAGQVAGRSRVYNQWGFGNKMSRGRGISAMFSGASGTGKTMAAEVLAKALQLHLYRVELPSMISKYIGETEKNLRRLFDAADRCGAILFFDEADSLFGKRTEVKDSHDRYANIEVNYLLQRMEEYNGLSILATNRKTDVDRAFLRRLRFLVDFQFPQAGERLRIWRKSFPPQTPTADLDFEYLSSFEIAGGNIRNIALGAAFLAAEVNEPVSMNHVLHAARREYSKLDKMIPDGGFRRGAQ